MSTKKGEKAEVSAEASMDDVIRLINNFKAGNFSQQLNQSSDPKLNALVQHLNEAATILAAHAAQTTQEKLLLNLIIDSTPDWIFIKDLNHRYLRVNKGFARALKLKPTDFIGKTDLDLGFPEDIVKGNPEKGTKGFWDADEQVKNSGKTLVIENDPAIIEGRTHTFHTIKTPVRNEKDEIVGVLGFARDITELKQNQIENNPITETMSEGLVVQGSKGDIQKFNPETLKILGLTEDELLGRTSMDPRWKSIKEDGSTFPGEEHPAIVALRTNQPVRNAVMGLTLPNGEERWLKINAIPFEAHDERKVACTFSDITSLVATNRDLKMIYEIMSEGMYLIGPDGKAKHMNNAAIKMLGFSKEELSEKTIHEQIHHTRHDGTFYKVEDCPLFAALRDQKTYSSDEDVFWKKDGTSFPVSYTSVPVFLNGGVTGALVTFKDITNVKDLQKTIDSERAKAAHNAKLASLGEMAAGIAHEINNPLAVIIANVSLVSKFRNDDVKFNSKLETITRSAERIEKIVKGLKKFARTSDGAGHKPENVASLVSEAVILTEAKSKRFDTAVETAIEENLSISCDGVEIEQVLVNLINNGIDAVKSSEVRWIKINAFSEGNEAVLQVIDSGHGIPVEIENKLFQPFFTTKVVGEGTGLGLSIAKGILDTHKASLILNRKMENTCFEIRFSKAGSSGAIHAA